MAGTTRWWWVRHAPVPNPDRRLYGQSDLEADVSDEAAFAALAAALPADAVWVASHLRRAHQTADALRPHLRKRGCETPEILAYPELAEQHFGGWQGMTFPELRAHLGDGFEELLRSPAAASPPAGECFADVIARVSGAVDRLTEAHAGRDIVAFAHGGSIRAALAHALGIDPDTALAFRIENLSITRIDHSTDGGEPGSGALRRWRIDGVNIRHRPGPPAP